MPNFAEILGCFESLGDNCELGMAQRFVGIEPLGFFRLNYCLMPALLRALQSDFAGIGDLDLIVEPNNEYRVRVRGYEFLYHSEKQVGEVAPEALLAQQAKAVTFLVRKLREDIAAAEKIFVRKGDDSRTLESIEPLFAALRQRGPVTLLWVVPEDAAHRSGTVEVLRDGLLKGYVDRLAPYTEVHHLSVAWLAMCANAYALWRSRAAPGTVRAGDPEHTASNLILFSDRLSGPDWAPGRIVATAVLAPDAADVPRLLPHSAVAEHVLREETGESTKNLLQHRVPRDLLPGERYVASLHVWIPAAFNGDLVRVHCAGFPAERLSPADLRERDCWQRIWGVAKLPDAADSATVALQVLGRRGSFLYSTAWQLERGTALRPYVGGTLKPVNG